MSRGACFWPRGSLCVQHGSQAPHASCCITAADGPPGTPRGCSEARLQGHLAAAEAQACSPQECFCSRLPRAMQRPAGWTGWGCWESGGGTCGLGPGLREGRLGAPHGHTCPCLSVEASLSNASFSHVGKQTQPSIMCLKYRSCRRYRGPRRRREAGWCPRGLLVAGEAGRMRLTFLGAGVGGAAICGLQQDGSEVRPVGSRELSASP